MAPSDDLPPDEERLETLLAGTIFLMSAHAREGGGERLAGIVARHLEAIADRCDPDGVLAATCERAADQWSQLSGGRGRVADADRGGAGRAASSPNRGLLRLVRS
jgi:hypothetical protein